VKKLLTTAVVAAMLAVPASASTLLFNGSFETGASAVGHTGQAFDDLAGNTGGRSWEIFQSIDGWTTTAGDGIEVQTSGTLSTHDAHEGEHYVELGARFNSRMEQTVALDEGLYRLSFYYAPRVQSRTTNRMGFGVFDELLGTNTVSSSVNARLSEQPGWELITREFRVENAGDFSVFFVATGRNDAVGGLIDNASLAPIPLPASGLLLLAGLGGMAAMRRRKKA
jgi:hypothetical protein